VKYTIVTIDDSRAANKQKIRDIVTLDEVTEIPFCDARLEYPQELTFTSPWTLTRGEIAIWHSHFNCWKWAADNGPLLVFEDDAILDKDFMFHFNDLVPRLPVGWDFLSLWVPPEQVQDYQYNVTFDENGYPHTNGVIPGMMDSKFWIGSLCLAKVYQGYSFVATLYSQEGARKMRDLALQKGMYTTADCFMFLEAHAGRLNGYAPTPMYARFVSHSWDEHPSLKGI